MADNTWYYVFLTCFASFSIYFIFLRIPEILDSFNNQMTSILAGLILVSLASLFFNVANTISLRVRRIGLTLVALYQLKSQIDNELGVNFPYRDITDHIAIVTGGNSGMGFGVAKQLVSQGCQVVITCRSNDRCNSAVSQIQSLYPNSTHLIEPMIMDLSDLQSIQTFVTNFTEKYQRLDYLVNNAGLVTSSGQRTKQGLEELIGSMHVGHFALTKWLLPLLTRPVEGGELYGHSDAARVINVASFGYLFGSFHTSLFTDPTGSGDFLGEYTDNCGTWGPMNLFSCCPMSRCPLTNGYSRAKLANILHAQELQRRFDEYVTLQKEEDPDRPIRRLVTASLHPGTVSTNIHPFLSFNSFVTRSSDQAGLLILYTLLDESFIPGSYIDSMKNGHDLSNHRATHVPLHTKAYPYATRLPFNVPPLFEGAFHMDMFNSLNFLQPTDDPIVASVNKGNMSIAVAARLWDVTNQIVKDWSDGKPLFSTPITETHRELF